MRFSALITLRVIEPAPARHSKNKFFLCSRLLSALITLCVIEPALARHSKNKFFLCSRLLAAFTFHFSPFSFQFPRRRFGTENHYTDTSAHAARIPSCR